MEQLPGACGKSAAALAGYAVGAWLFAGPCDVDTSRDAEHAALRYEKLVEQGKDVHLWDDALKQQIFLGDDAFIQRMQTLLDPERARAEAVPRGAKLDSIQTYLKVYARDEAMVTACREGGHSLSAIAREVGLSVPALGGACPAA